MLSDAIWTHRVNFIESPDEVLFRMPCRDTDGGADYEHLRGRFMLSSR